MFTGAAELRVKESDRLAVMAAGPDESFGVRNRVLPDGMRIVGGGASGGRIDSHGDHRIAMSFAVAEPAWPMSRSEIPMWPTWRTSFPGFVGTAHGRRAAKSTSWALTQADARHHHRRPQRLRQRHRQPRASPRALGWHLLDSGALYRLVALAGVRPGPGDAPTMAAMRGLAEAMDRDLRRATPDGGERVFLGRAATSPPTCAPKRPGRAASRVAAWPAVRDALLRRQQRLRRATRTGRRRPGHGHGRFPRRAASRSS